MSKRVLPRIYFGPQNINYFSSMMAREFTRRGYRAQWQLYYGNWSHDDLSTCVYLDRISAKGRLYRWAFLFKNLSRLLREVDIFHFTSYSTLLPYRLDLPILKSFGKKICMSYMGTDLRVDSSDALCDMIVCSVGGNADRKSSIYRSQRYYRTNRWIDAQIVMDPTIFPSPKLYPEYFLKETPFYYVQTCVDVDNITYIPRQPSDVITILHIPSNTRVKGTEFVLPVFERLRNEFKNVRTVLLSGVPHVEYLQRMAEADIVVEHLTMNMGGGTAKEAMAMGKVVVTRMNSAPVEMIRSLHPIFDTPLPPVVPAKPETLYDVLVDLLRHPERLPEMGVKGRQFVEAVHSPIVVADRLESIYQQIWNS